MYIKAQYNMYHLAYSLIKQDQYEVIHLNIKQNEIWLEKVEGKFSIIIRFVQKGFNWKNHLKLDIASVFQRVKNIKKYLKRKNVEIFNVYITEHEPVDNWESLKKPIQLKDRKPLKMNVYYIAEENMNEERMRLLKQINSTIKLTQNEPIESEQQMFVELYKMKMFSDLQMRNNRLKELFSAGKPKLIYGIILLYLSFYFILFLYSDENVMQFLNNSINNSNLAVTILAMFKHINPFHVMVNVILLYFIGSMVERVFGSVRLLSIYLLSFIGIVLISYSLQISIGAGATILPLSLIGALAMFILLYRDIFFETLGKNVFVIILTIFLLIYLIEETKIIPHLLGFVYGFLVACIVYLPKKSDKNIQMMASSIFFLLCLLFLIIH